MPPSAVPQRLILYQDNTQKINIFGLKDDSGAFLNTATLEATLLDSHRNEVDGLNGVTMSYITDSNGNYSGTVDSGFRPAVATDYTLVITGDQGASHLHMEIPTEVRVRTL